MSAPQDITVSVLDPRNQATELLARVRRGETFIIAEDGEPVAELCPRPAKPLRAAQLVARRQLLPAVDAEALRYDMEAILR